jgi:hypothetical protein
MFKQPFTICSIQFSGRIRSAHGETRTKKLEAAWIVFPIKPINDLHVMQLVMEGCSRALLCEPGSSAPGRANNIIKMLRRAAAGSRTLSGVFSSTFQRTTDLIMPKPRLLGRHELQLDTTYCGSGSLWQWCSISIDVHCLDNAHCRNNIIHRSSCTLCPYNRYLYVRQLSPNDCKHFKKTNLKSKYLLMFLKIICLKCRIIFCLLIKLLKTLSELIYKNANDAIVRLGPQISVSEWIWFGRIRWSLVGMN